MRCCFRICIGGLVVLLCGWNAAAWAQQVQGSFTGAVTDPSGAVIPGVTVKAVEEEKGFARSAITLQDGSYDIPLLPPGHYRLTAEKAGFQKAVQGPYELLVDAHLKIDFQLKVGEQSTSITVESAPPVLDTQSSSVGTTIEQQKVGELPLNGRVFLELTLLTPGVVPGTSASENSTRGGAINVNGLRESMNFYLLDGMSNTSVAVGTYATTPPVDSVQEFRMETGLYEAKFGTNAGAQVNVVTKSGTNHFHGTAYEYLRNSALDARNFFDPRVPPFRRNQFGATVGGPIAIPNVYDGHDRSFFFFAYEGLRERREFFPLSRVPPLAERRGDFTDLLAPDCPTQTVLLNTLTVVNPQAPLLFGNNLNLLAAALPTGTLDPIGQAFVNLYPPPNIPNAGCGAANYIAEGNRRINTDSYVARVDHRWGSKNSLFARYSGTSDRQFRPFGNTTNVPGYGINVHNNFHQTGLDWTHIFSPSLINEAKIAYNRWTESLINQDRGNLFAKQLGIANLSNVPSQIGVPALNFAGYASLGAETITPQGGSVNTFQLADTLTHVRGNHTFAYGFDIKSIKRGNFTRDIRIRGQYDMTGVVTGGLVLETLQQELPSLPPQLQQQLLAEMQAAFQACPPASCSFGNSVADALLGLPQDWINGFEAHISGAGTEYNYFAQDTWKARRNLTLNLGLRYEYNSLVTEKADHFSSFDFAKGLIVQAGRDHAALLSFDPTTGLYVPSGTESFGSTSENRALQHPDRDNWAPRIGFAWQPFGDSRTVIRSGYGVFYDQTFGDVYFQRAQNPPFVRITAGRIDRALPQLLPLILNGTLPLGSGAFIQNAFALAAVPLFPVISPFQIDFQDSFVQEWSFDVQRELPGSWLLDLGYVGTRGLRLPRLTDPNQPNIAAGGVRRFPAFDQNFVYTESSGGSIYHGLQFKAERHYSHGLGFLAAYTYSKSIDTNSTFLSTDRNGNFPQNSFDLAAEKGPSDFDFRHRLSLAYIYELPFGTTLWKPQSPAANYVIQGWQLAGIVTAQSGPQFTPIIAGDVSCTEQQDDSGDSTDRPNLVGNPYPSVQTPNQWILPTAFRDPRFNAAGVQIAPCAFGNAGRNFLKGPSLFDWDFCLIRKFRLTESKSLEFRAEMFNIFNRSNFETPIRDVASPSFGKIFNTVQSIAGLASGGPGDPREIQFALRFIW